MIIVLKNRSYSPFVRVRKPAVVTRSKSSPQVRLMNEPSNQPPKLMSVGPYLQKHNPQTGLQRPAADANRGRWRLRFSQPASNYVDFRRRLDTENVSLENVIVRSSDRRIVGTVKVRNVSYDKLVFVRCTDDGWATHRDTACTYVRNNGVAALGGASSQGAGNGADRGGADASSACCNGVTAIYDTFSFRLPLPADSTDVQFAVCYKTDDFECWDNNSGQNYRLSVDVEGDNCARPASSCSPPPRSAPTTTAAAPPASTAQSPPPPAPAVQHYFGSHSGQNTWDLWRHDDSSAYW